MFLYSPSHQHYKPIFFVGDFTTMMTVNKLTKIVSGSLALGAATAASLLLAPSAGAVGVTFVGDFDGVVCSQTTLALSRTDCGVQGLEYHSVQLDDKLFQNFDFAVPFLSANVVIDFDGADWSFEYDPEPDLGDGTYTIGYDVDILDPNQFFDLIQLGTITSVFPTVTVTKTITDSNTGAFLGELESIDEVPTNGITTIDISRFNTRHISILDEIVVNTLVPGQSAELEALSNDFTQDTHDVPEPGTILGLLAVGGAGLLSKLKKQK
jgi:hypothetical protein